MRKSPKALATLIFCAILSATAFTQERPAPDPNAKEADLLELVKLDSSIKLDIRYARTDNFVGKKVYPEARAFLQRPAAESVLRVHRHLKKTGLGLVIFDGYRPWAVTKIFWDVTPEDKRIFVANPKTGSKHNRGCAVDLSIYDLKTGREVPMPSDFDEFTERASPDYKGGSAAETRNRELLRSLMEAEGFTVNANEWWHFDYKDWKSYDIYDIAFSEIRDTRLIEGFHLRSVRISVDESGKDEVLRKRLDLHAGELFSISKLRKGLASVNAIGKFKRLTLADVSWFPDKGKQEVDLIVFVKARPRKR